VDLRGHNCVVTGASSGIGRAITVAFAAAGATVYAVARRREELEATAQLARPDAVVPLHADLTREDAVLELARTLGARDGGMDVLVHSAGTWSYGGFDTAPVAELDRQYATNVRAPYLLTQALLPALRASAGQVVFVNSTAGLTARAGVAQYAATKHALKAMADALREEVNSEGIRVLTVYPGRTASPLQARIFQVEGRPYLPERLMQPEDVASAVLHAITLPRTAEITDLTVRQMLKS
jgi:NAD(P)-dependent dehydrogenase (short-subunit alcohol dehydrogenase family)